jgi:hypothetical protein
MILIPYRVCCLTASTTIPSLGVLLKFGVMLLNTIVEFSAPAAITIQICNIKLLKLQIYDSLFSTKNMSVLQMNVFVRAMDYGDQPGIQYSPLYFRKLLGCRSFNTAPSLSHGTRAIYVSLLTTSLCDKLYCHFVASSITIPF